MTCPYCKKETPSIFRFCQECKTDLEEYRQKRNQALEGVQDHTFAHQSSLLNFFVPLGPIGGLLAAVFSVVWFVAGYLDGKIYFYPPVLFVFGLALFFSSIAAIKKRKALKKKMESGEIID